MSIFSAPNFYSNVDRQIYNAGNYFIPQQQFRDSAFNITAPVTDEDTTTPTGINTVFNQGGGGGGVPFTGQGGLLQGIGGLFGKDRFLGSLGIKRYPQDSQTTTALSPFTINSNTLKKDTRARGRFLNIKIENDAASESWRFGTLKLDLQQDGRR